MSVHECLETILQSIQSTQTLWVETTAVQSRAADRPMGISEFHWSWTVCPFEARLLRDTSFEASASCFKVYTEGVYIYIIYYQVKQSPRLGINVPETSVLPKYS